MKYKTKVENQLFRKIERLRFDRDGEYGSKILKQVYGKHEIIQKTAILHTPEQNGVAKRKLEC